MKSAVHYDGRWDGTPPIPDYTGEGLNAYATDHVPLGSFLRACVENDLTTAFGKADSNNLSALPNILCWLYNEAPSDCWGSPAKVAAWLGETP